MKYIYGLSFDTYDDITKSLTQKWAKVVIPESENALSVEVADDIVIESRPAWVVLKRRAKVAFLMYEDFDRITII